MIRQLCKQTMSNLENPVSKFDDVCLVSSHLSFMAQFHCVAHFTALRTKVTLKM